MSTGTAKTLGFIGLGDRGMPAHRGPVGAGQANNHSKIIGLFEEVENVSGDERGSFP